MASVELDNVIANSVRTTDLQAGNAIFTGAARFANGIYGDVKNSQNINQVQSSTSIADDWTLLISTGTALRRISFADLCNAIAEKVDEGTLQSYPNAAINTF